jgi:hypothetical protein
MVVGIAGGEKQVQGGMRVAAGWARVVQVKDHSG